MKLQWMKEAIIITVVCTLSLTDALISSNHVLKPKSSYTHPFRKSHQLTMVKKEYPNNHDPNDNNDNDDYDKRLPLSSVSLNRRESVSAFLSSACGMAALVSSQPRPALAKDELFKPNPLTNPVLEQMRIWEQAEADNVKYGGELTPGSPKGRDTYAKLLVPILTIEADIATVDALVRQQPEGSGLSKAEEILSRPHFQKIAFKKIFNAFADNIYYSDPDRANVYLGGGATPKNEQSIAYLLRNDVLTNIEALQAEVTYLIKEQTLGNELETEDLYQYSRVAREGMVKYLNLVPPGELTAGRELFSKL